MDSEHFVSQEWFKITEKSGTNHFPYVHFGRAGRPHVCYGGQYINRKDTKTTKNIIKLIDFD